MLFDAVYSNKMVINDSLDHQSAATRLGHSDKYKSEIPLIEAERYPPDSRTDMQLHIARYIHGMESRTSGLLKLSPSKNITKMYCTCYEVLKKKHKIMRSLSSIKHLFRFINQFVFYHQSCTAFGGVCNLI